MAEPMISVRVPATSANLGAGFDTLGAAFKMYNTFSFRAQEDSRLIIRGVRKKYQNKENLVYKAMLRVFDEAGTRPNGIFLHERSDIPVGRGLGSSATCIVAGLVGANELIGSPLPDERIFELAVDMEGHPDNVAPALYGGITTSMMTPKKTFCVADTLSPVFNFYACIPDFKLPTVKARAVLPKQIPMKDAVYNISRANMAYLALTRGMTDAIPAAVSDKLHEPYRRGLIAHSKEVTHNARRYGALTTYISGAGPTLMIITDEKNRLFEDKMRKWMRDHLPSWSFSRLLPDVYGVSVRRKN